MFTVTTAPVRMVKFCIKVRRHWSSAWPKFFFCISMNADEQQLWARKISQLHSLFDQQLPHRTSCNEFDFQRPVELRRSRENIGEMLNVEDKMITSHCKCLQMSSDACVRWIRSSVQTDNRTTDNANVKQEVWLEKFHIIRSCVHSGRLLSNQIHVIFVLQIQISTLHLQISCITEAHFIEEAFVWQTVCVSLCSLLAEKCVLLTMWINTSSYGCRKLRRLVFCVSNIEYSVNIRY